MRSKLKEFQANTPGKENNAIKNRVEFSGLIGRNKSLPLNGNKLEIQYEK